MYTYKFKESGKATPRAGAATYYETALRERKALVEWSPFERSAFRALFVFFLIQIVPWHPDFYGKVFAINWLTPHFKQLLDLVTFLPEVIATPEWGIWSFSNWLVYGAIAVIASIAWGAFDSGAREYNFLQYLLRAGVRYKLGVGLIVCGFYLLFQQQMPYPSLSNLHTNYGDMFAWKLYFQTTAINPGYQSFLGFVEIAAGALILYPRTVTLGTGVVLGFLGNVAMVNLFYDVGHHIYVNFLLLSSAYLFAYDVPRLYALLVKGTKAFGNKYYPVWKNSKLTQIRQVLRISAFLFVLLTGARAYALVDKPFKVPQQRGIAGAFGYYIPTVFKINNEEIPYSLTDPNRWQDVIFEEWSTISIRINRPVVADITDGDVVTSNDLERNYETAGSLGRHYFHYTKDSSSNVIHLQNKNVNHRKEVLDLRYSFPTDSTMVLEGTNWKNEKVYAELLRVQKKYFMYEGRRSRIKL